MNSLLRRETFLNCPSLVLSSNPIILTVLSRPAGESFTVEIAANRGVTSLSFDGQYATAWGDGQNHPDNYSILNLDGAPLTSSGCIGSPNSEYRLHCLN
jgi:hypothetical protein